MNPKAPASSSGRSPTPLNPADPSAPPWLWFWAATWLANLPGQVGLVRQGLVGLDVLRAGTARLQAVDPAYGRWNALLYPSVLLDVWPPVALALGLLLAALPRVRGAYLERRYRLGPPPAGIAPLREIAAWAAEHLPGLEVRANLLRPGMLAFVYPGGWRGARLAVFGGLVRLWAADRPAAEAVLLHEAAHHRRGDAAIIGAGSVLEGLVRHALLGGLLLLVAPAVVLFGEQLLRARGELLAAGIDGAEVWAHQAQQIVTLHAPGLALTVTGQLLRLLSYVALPVAAMWSAEVEADRRALREGGADEALRRTLARMAPAGRWRWALMRLSHPPVRLRRWILGRPRPSRAAAGLLLYPLGYLARLLLLAGWAACAYGAMGLGAEAAWSALRENAWAYVVALRGIWLALAAALLAWPVVAAWWEGLFARQRGPVTRPGALHLLAALPLALLAALAFLVPRYGA